MTLDRKPVFQFYSLLIMKFPANIDGAVRVHDLSSWPDTQKLFVFCDEPTVLAKSGGLCDMSGTIAYA